MTVTLKDIADAVGVGKSTVSVVLNNKPNRIKISEKTRERIFQAVKDLNYHPSAAARALATKRTGHLGFMLSDVVADGLANAFYGRHLAGVERVCRDRGYGLNVCLYNLSNIESFVFPAKVGQRSVDGLILADHVEKAVIERFREFGVPCVSLGESVEVLGEIPTVACQFVDGMFEVVRYLVSLGHKRIAYHVVETRRAQEVLHLVSRRTETDPTMPGCRVVPFCSERVGRDYGSAPELVKQWLAHPPAERPTAIISSDQAIVALLTELDSHGLSCPRNISLVAGGDTSFCKFSRPAVTALAVDCDAMGGTAATMLIDHLEDNTPLTVASSQNDHPCWLVKRASCGPTPDYTAAGESL